MSTRPCLDSEVNNIIERLLCAVQILHNAGCADVDLHVDHLLGEYTDTISLQRIMNKIIHDMTAPKAVDTIAEERKSA